MSKKTISPAKFFDSENSLSNGFSIFLIREFVKSEIGEVFDYKTEALAHLEYEGNIFGKDLSIEEEHEVPIGYKRLKQTCPFVPIHMASKGYWQVQDEEPHA